MEAAAVGGGDGGGGGGRSGEEGMAEADLGRAEAEESYPQQEPSIWPLIWHVGQFVFASFPRVNIQTISILQFCKQFSIHLGKKTRRLDSNGRLICNDICGPHWEGKLKN